MTRTIITSRCNYDVTFWKPEIARNCPSVEVDSNMSPIIIDALTPCLKTAECFRSCPIQRGNRGLSILHPLEIILPATFVDKANPIENNVPKFATPAPYHLLQCTRMFRNWFSENGISFGLPPVCKFYNQGKLKWRPSWCILGLKVISGIIRIQTGGRIENQPGWIFWDLDC